ncbi:EamA/RhaT family transporter [Seminibacterium arietis]|uniref:EamA/RhaT family transporter n=1 Tax=Seminibacterium arietis TaxID=1173502 RepID=A0ABW3I763_9PAST
MHNLIIAILCSVAVSALLKVARKKNLIVEQMIAFNYITAILLSYFLLKPDFKGLQFSDVIIQSEQSIVFIILGILLPAVFIIMAKAVEFAGIVRSDAAQRLSLFLPIAASFLIFGEQFSQSRLVSIVLAFFSLFFLLLKPSGNISTNTVKGAVTLILVWLGYGIIDILFKQVAKTGSNFPTVLFISFFFSACFTFIYLLIKKTTWTVSGLLYGIMLGFLNFMNILFYIKAHQSFNQNPTIVFTAMNIGVICLGTVIGATVFKERISKTNGVGVALGICSILCLFLL